MDKKVYEITYTKDGNDGAAYTELHSENNVGSLEYRFNSLILNFNRYHPANDRVESIHEINVEGVKLALEDIIAEFRKGTFVFTEDDAEYIEYAIEFLKGV